MNTGNLIRPGSRAALLCCSGLLGVVFAAILLKIRGVLLLRFEIPTFVRIAIPIILLYAVYNHVSSLKRLGPMWSPGPTVHAVHELVVEGPYGFVRHPIYLSGILYLLSCTAILRNYLSAGVALLGVIILLVKAALEERLLRKRFGKLHKEYTRRVPFMLPRFRLLLMAAGVLGILSLLTGCASLPGADKAPRLVDLDSAFLLPLKYCPQKPGGCAVSAMRSVCEYYSLECGGLDGIYNPDIQGTKLISLVNYSKRYFRARTERLGYDEIRGVLASGKPVILLKDKPRHYYLLVGYGEIGGVRYLVAHDGYDANVLLPATTIRRQNGVCVVLWKKEDE